LGLHTRHLFVGGRNAALYEVSVARFRSHGGYRVRWALHQTWPHVNVDRFSESSFGAVSEFVRRARAAPGVRLSSVNVCTFFGRRRRRLARAAADLALEAVVESSSEGSASIEDASVVELASPSGETGTAADM